MCPAECAQRLTPKAMATAERYAQRWQISPEDAIRIAQNCIRTQAMRDLKHATVHLLLLEDPLCAAVDRPFERAMERAVRSMKSADARAEQKAQGRVRDREQDAEDAKLAVERGLQPWKKTGLKGSTREVLYMLLGDHDYAERVSQTYGDVGVQSRTDAEYVYARWELKVGETLTTARQKSRGGWIVVPSRRIESAEPVTVVGGQTIWRAKLGQYLRKLTEPYEPANEP